jgi:predicted site-specific integrase-resolvase
LVFKEVGSGLNDKRKKLQQVLTMVSKGEVRNVYVTYKDRLTRFGFNYLETMFNACGTNIIIVKDENEEKSVQEELVEDMMSLIASFSGKLYGMRSRKAKQDKGAKVK